MKSAVIIVCNLVLSVISAPAPILKDKIFAQQYMTRFGYLESEDSSQLLLTVPDPVKMKTAVKQFQEFANLPVTGELDSPTLQMMQLPRCGVPDIVKSNSSMKKRVKRYFVTQRKWNKRDLTYHVVNGSQLLDMGALRTELRRAWDIWARYSGLRFREVASTPADVMISFNRGDHGSDNFCNIHSPFDGLGRTLAHAFLPVCSPEDSLGGDIHFDDDELWKINPRQDEDGFDFFSTAVHEIGHSLGLSHSSNSKAVMFSYYQRFERDSFDLNEDDIRGIREIYDESSENEEPQRPTTTKTRKPITSKPTTRKPTTVTFINDDEPEDKHKHKTPRPEEPKLPTTPDACEGYFDAVAYLRQELFIFKQNHFWRLNRPGNISNEYPIPVDRMFTSLSKELQIDAVYERETDSNFVFFSGKNYWVTDGVQILDRSPRPLSEYGLPSYVDRVDAAWAINGKTYLSSGNQLWRFDSWQKTRKHFSSSHVTIDSGYPKPLDDEFSGLTTDIDSAMTKDGMMYFFKDNLYWAFNHTTLTTEDLYPLPASVYLLNCPMPPDFDDSSSFRFNASLTLVLSLLSLIIIL